MMRVEPLASLLPQALLIEPSSKLSFRVCIATLVLTNPSARTVFFKVKTNAPVLFTVNPTVGSISPGESLSIKVERYPTNTAKEYELQRHSFVIHSAFGPDTMICPKEFWKNAETVEVMRTKLRAVFTEGSPTLVQSSGIHANNRDSVTLQRETELRGRTQKQIDLLPKEPTCIQEFCSSLMEGTIWFLTDDEGNFDCDMLIGLIIVFTWLFT
uniref:Major sperm protein n=1 Tax=Ditylenchus dipsaci TaxID=166011 RepID=A0A915ES54_9BILA